MTKRFAWRKVFWAYQSAAGGWCVFIFKRGYHIKALD